MNVFYNTKGIGDVLLVTVKDGDRTNLDYEKKGDAVRIFDKTSGETTGYNLFNASSYLSVEGDGMVELDEELAGKINEIIKKNGFAETLDADLSPKFVVGHVLEKAKHPNADKLSICKVDVGAEVLQIVCGAPNVDDGQKVVVAKPGAVMPSGMVIKDAELRGVASSGMICSAKELDLPDAPAEKGILVLEGGRKPGEPFFE